MATHNTVCGISRVEQQQLICFKVALPPFSQNPGSWWVACSGIPVMTTRDKAKETERGRLLIPSVAATAASSSTFHAFYSG